MFAGYFGKMAGRVRTIILRLVGIFEFLKYQEKKRGRIIVQNVSDGEVRNLFLEQI